MTRLNLNMNMLGDRIKQARTAAGLSQEALAKQAGVSTMSISKYERGSMNPSSNVLLKMAGALGVRTEYFFRVVELDISEPDFRKDKKLTPSEQTRVIAQMREAIERWVELEELTPTPWSKSFMVPSDVVDEIDNLDDMEAVAETIRDAWELGAQPIGDLSDLLERQGIKVFMLGYDAGKRWDGLVAKANGEPVVVVGSDWPGDRQRFTLAHELGHLVLAGRLRGALANNENKEESACHRFAGAFLMPKSAVVDQFGPTRSWIEPAELLHAKREWGLSMSAMIFRARDTGVLTKTNAGKMFGYFKKQKWLKQEPGPKLPPEKPSGFKQFVFRALAEDLISESKAAELLLLSLANFRAERRVADGAPDVAAAPDK